MTTLLKIILSVLLLVSCSTTIKPRHRKLSGDELLILGKAARINNKKEKARVYIKRSCEKGSLEGCWLYTDYMNSYEDRKKVKAIMNKACQEGFKVACPSQYQYVKRVKKTDIIHEKKYNVSDDSLARLIKGIVQELSQ